MMMMMMMMMMMKMMMIMMFVRRHLARRPFKSVLFCIQLLVSTLFKFFPIYFQLKMVALDRLYSV